MRLTLRFLVLAAIASPAAAQGTTAPEAIDAAVAAFLGAQAGAPGGARAAVDRRLRLAACSRPLDVAWYGTGGRTLEVRCAGPAWRIFVQVEGVQGAAGTGAPIVQRGETVALTYQGSGFSLSRQAEALEAGARGQWIRVRPVGEKSQPLRVEVVAPGEVRAGTS